MARVAAGHMRQYLLGGQRASAAERRLGALQDMVVTDYCEVVDRRAACH